MYLFDQNGDKLEIYSMNPKYHQITDFKKQEMEKILKEHRILEIITNTDDLPFANKFTFQTENEPIDIDKKSLHYYRKKIIGNEYHRLQVPSNLTASEDFTEKNLTGYYNGSYDYSQIVRVHEYDINKQKLNFVFYLLLNNYYVKESEHSKIQTINKIVNIPESLYLLELIRRGQFSLLENKDITEQLELFTISEGPVKKYSLKDLEEQGQYGLGLNAFYKAISKVREDKEIFKRIRRK